MDGTVEGNRGKSREGKLPSFESGAMAGTLNYYRGTAPRLAPQKKMVGPEEYPLVFRCEIPVCLIRQIARASGKLVSASQSIPHFPRESRESLLALREQATKAGVEWSIDETASDIRFSLTFDADKKNGTYDPLPKHYQPLLSELPPRKPEPPRRTTFTRKF